MFRILGCRCALGKTTFKRAKDQKMAQPRHNAAAFCRCTSVAADSDVEGAHIWQNLSKTISGDCCAVSGNYEETGFISGYKTGIHYWEIVTGVCEPSTGGAGEGGGKENPPSFAVEIVTGDLKPGKIFLESKPALGVLGVGFGYIRSRAQIMNTGCEPRSYGMKFAACDTIGVMLLLQSWRRAMNFFGE